MADPVKPPRVLVVMPSSRDRHVLENDLRSEVDVEYLATSDIETAPPKLHEGADLTHLIERGRRRLVDEGLPSIDGVFFSFDIANFVAGVLAQGAGLAGPTPEAVFRCYHKFLARLCSGSRLGYDQLRYGHRNGTWGPIDEVPRDGYPVYVKPVSLSYGLLGARCTSRNELASHGSEIARRYAPWWSLIRSAAREHLDWSQLPALDLTGTPLLVEEYVDGQAVTCDGYVQDGELRILGIVDTVKRADGSVDHYTVPSTLPTTTQTAIRDFVTVVVQRLGLDDTLFSVEVWVRADAELELLECNARMSSTFRTMYLKLMGIDLYRIAIEIACGVTASSDGTDVTGSGRRAAQIYVSTHRTGLAAELLDFGAAARLRAEGHDLHLNYAPDEQVTPHGSQPAPLAEIDILAESPGEVDHVASHLRRLLLRS